MIRHFDDREGKKLLVIDEFPYMVHANAQIPSILQKMWDGPMKQADVMLVLCGSATSFIEKEILAEKNPLYGRASRILRLEEMDCYDAAQFFPAYDAADRIRAYAVLGAFPISSRSFRTSAASAKTSSGIS